MVRHSNSGHQLLLPPADWCSMFASRATQVVLTTFLMFCTGGGEPDPTEGEDGRCLSLHFRCHSARD